MAGRIAALPNSRPGPGKPPETLSTASLRERLCCGGRTQAIMQAKSRCSRSSAYSEIEAFRDTLCGHRGDLSARLKYLREQTLLPLRRLDAHAPREKSGLKPDSQAASASSLTLSPLCILDTCSPRPLLVSPFFPQYGHSRSPPDPP